MQKYKSIKAFRPVMSEAFKPGDWIVIHEKIDGSNYSVKPDRNEKVVKGMSRRHELTPLETMRGAYGFTMSLDYDKINKALGDKLILFGEWLTKHTIVYPQDCYQKAYFYDVFNVETNTYLPQDEVTRIIDELGLISVPVFYSGPFISWDHVYSFVGKTGLGGDIGEGIVVKNMTRLRPNEFDHSEAPFYVKIVTSEFRETKSHRFTEVDLAALHQKGKDIAITRTIVTKARVQKMIHNLVDEDIIPEDWDSEHMKTIAKHLGKRIYEDCLKEEPETVALAGDQFGRYASYEAMSYAKQILAAK